MKVSLIVAMDRERGIGKNNDLMWHLPADMKFFRETTTGHIVVLGRKNYESIPEKFRPLPNRENAVLTRSEDFKAEGCVVFHSLESCLDHYRNETERVVYIIGGGQIYEQVLKTGEVEEMYITHVDRAFGADTFFAEFDEAEWQSETVMRHGADEKHVVGFEVKKYVKKR
jgi:dihydrofolate reductase